MEKKAGRRVPYGRYGAAEPRLQRLKGEECGRLRSLWEEVFYEDSKEFTDYYFREKAVRNYGYVLENEEEAAAMLYLSPYPVMIRSGAEFVCQEINYVVGVATREKYRHKGYMDRLLRTALQDMYEKAYPFTFLMPANPAIYRPYQFAYIYDRKEYALQEENEGKGIEKEGSDLRKWTKTEENLSRLAEFAQDYLEKNCDVFIRREAAYYDVMDRELQTQRGGICVMEGTDGTDGLDGIEGYFLYTQEGEMCEIQEAVVTKEKGGRKEPVIWTGVTTPNIMARIVDVHAMLSLLRAKCGEVHVYLRVSDPILAGNNRIWECFFSEEEANVCGYEQEFIKKPSAELMAASVEMGEAKRKAETKPISMAAADIKIEALVSWIFYHRDAGECFCFEDGIDAVKKEEILWKLRNIRRLERVFINEIV